MEDLSNHSNDLSKIVDVKCIRKGYKEYDYEEFITYNFIIHNKSDKDIRAIKGLISFTNLFGDEINSLGFVYDEPIKSGKKNNYNATTDYNQYIDRDRDLKNKDLKDLKVIWKPEKIIFSDGSSIG
ncbi:hypothetical protein [Aquimarina algiphila]|uniref:hypothetical protein n=1 Tax=Aquimarina algiphila TaxID=2047982 RepID=UPI0024916468|nr:hypothetical protein [Aquimarina algiphila]